MSMVSFWSWKIIKNVRWQHLKKFFFFLQPPAQLQNTVIRLADYHFDLATGCCCRVDLPLVLVRATRFHQCFCRWLPAGFRSQVAWLAHGLVCTGRARKSAFMLSNGGLGERKKYIFMSFAKRWETRVRELHGGCRQLDYIQISIKLRQFLSWYHAK